MYGYENTHEAMTGVKNIISLVLYGAMALLFGVVSIYMLISQEAETWMAVAMLAVSAIILFVIVLSIKTKLDEKKRWPEIIKEKQNEYDQSMKRLQESDYFMALAQVDSKAKQAWTLYQNGNTSIFAPRPHK